jgi:hypothetical protein
VRWLLFLQEQIKVIIIMCRPSPDIVECDEESEQDCRISEQCGGSHTGQVVWHRGGRIGLVDGRLTPLRLMRRVDWTC